MASRVGRLQAADGRIVGRLSADRVSDDKEPPMQMPEASMSRLRGGLASSRVFCVVSGSVGCCCG